MSTLPADEKLIDGRCLKEAIVKVYVEGVAGASHCSKYKSIVVRLEIVFLSILLF